MRRAVNCVAAAAALVLCAGLGFFYYQQYQADHQLDEVSFGLRRFEQVLAFRGASKDAQVTERGWPLTVDPKWFAGDAPRNLLLTPDRPWLEIATPDQANMTNPPLRLAIGTSIAAYWYNPYQGVIRARVPIALSDQRALDTYNRVNGTSLDTIYCADAVSIPPPAPEESKPADPPSSDPTTQASAEPAPAQEPPPAPHP